MTANSSLQDQLREALPPRREKPAPQIIAYLYEGDSVQAESWIEFRPADSAKKLRFRSKIDLFTQMRDALRLLSGDNTWALRYASQIHRENHPFLHSGQKRTILFDPFMAFRDPVREFLSTRVFVWQVFPSNSYYFKLQREVQDCQSQLDAVNALSSAASGVLEEPSDV